MGYEAALQKLSGWGALEIARRWMTGPLRSIAEIYIPYRLYKVTIEDRRSQTFQTQHCAVDAAAGTLDPYVFVTLPQAEAWIEVETRNFHPVRLDESQTKTLVAEKARALLYARGFFRVANPNIAAELIKSEFYIPYWAGFYGNEQDITLILLNAVRETVEGRKLAELVHAWLVEQRARKFSGC